MFYKICDLQYSSKLQVIKINEVGREGEGCGSSEKDDGEEGRVALKELRLLRSSRALRWRKEPRGRGGLAGKVSMVVCIGFFC